MAALWAVGITGQALGVSLKSSGSLDICGIHPMLPQMMPVGPVLHAHSRDLRENIQTRGLHLQKILVLPLPMSRLTGCTWKGKETDTGRGSMI